MSINELLARIDMGNADEAERQRRIEMCLDALETGNQIRGILDGRVTFVDLNSAGDYTVTQTWTVAGQAVQHA